MSRDNRGKWEFVLGWMAVIYGAVAGLGVIAIVNGNVHVVDEVLALMVCLVCAAGWAAIRRTR